MSSLFGLVFISVISALAAQLPRFLREVLPMDHRLVFWGAILIFAALAAFRFLPSLQIKSWVLRRKFDGFADLFLQIHRPALLDHPLRWIKRGVLSLFAALFGLGVGPEGAAIEWSYASTRGQRSRSAHWFESRRRTDAGLSLAAGISAAFGAPFAAVLLPLELGAGGRVLSIALVSIGAFLTSKFTHFLMLQGYFSSHPIHTGWVDLGAVLNEVRFDHWQEWAITLVLAVGASFGAFVVGPLWRWIDDQIGSSSIVRFAIAATSILVLCAALPVLTTLAPESFEAVLWGRRTLIENFILLLALPLLIGVMRSVLGSSGIFWPVLLLGGTGGVLFGQLPVDMLPQFASTAGIIGAIAFFASFFQAPIAASLLAYELTGNVTLLLPSLVAAFVARFVARKLGVTPWLDQALKIKDLTLVQGRALDLLKAISVKDAMIRDHETVAEGEALTEVRDQIARSRYPFLPVINAQGVYLGLVTIDLVQEALTRALGSQGHRTSRAVGRVVEAKDLVTRGGLKPPTLLETDTLDQVSSRFEEFPCVPVLNDSGAVVGLLFVHQVRLVYERELARRSLFEVGGESVSTA